MTLTRKYLILVDFSKKDYNAQITEIEVQIPSITGLATTVVLNAIENKIPKACNLVKKKQIMVEKYANKFTGEILNAKDKRKGVR